LSREEVAKYWLGDIETAKLWREQLERLIEWNKKY